MNEQDYSLLYISYVGPLLNTFSLSMQDVILSWFLFRKYVVHLVVCSVWVELWFSSLKVLVYALFVDVCILISLHVAIKCLYMYK